MLNLRAMFISMIHKIFNAIKQCFWDSEVGWVGGWVAKNHHVLTATNQEVDPEFPEAEAAALSPS